MTEGAGADNARPEREIEINNTRTTPGSTDAGVALSGLAIETAEPKEAPTRAERLGRREWTRSSLAFAFVLIFALTIAFVMSKVGTRDWGETKELLQILLPAETALLGSALGFYFGTRSNER